MPRALRSVFAVIAGYFAMAVIVMILTGVTVTVLHVQTRHPTRDYVAINVMYSLGAAVLGGWVAGKVAGRSPMAYGIALAGLMFVFGFINFMTMDDGQSLAYKYFLMLGLPLVAIAGAAMVRRN